MPETGGSHATTSRPSDPSVGVDADELTHLVRPPRAGDGPVFTAVWRDVSTGRRSM